MTQLRVFGVRSIIKRCFVQCLSSNPVTCVFVMCSQTFTLAVNPVFILINSCMVIFSVSLRGLSVDECDVVME